MIEVDLTQQKIELKDSVIECPEEHGAQVVFSGVVRNLNHGRKVLAVSYDAQVNLAKNVLQTIAEEAQGKCGNVLSIRISHRFGRLAVGEISLLIVVSSPHREESYEASRYLIEEIKHRAPIWKKEHYQDGESEWLQGHALCGSMHAKASARHESI